MHLSFDIRKVRKWMIHFWLIKLLTLVKYNNKGMNSSAYCYRLFREMSWILLLHECICVYIDILMVYMAYITLLYVHLYPFVDQRNFWSRQHLSPEINAAVINIVLFHCLCSMTPCLAHWGWDKIGTISQKTFSNAFSLMKVYALQSRFH